MISSTYSKITRTLYSIETFFIKFSNIKHFLKFRLKDKCSAASKKKFQEKRKLASLELQLKEIKGSNAKMLLENEIKMKELELKYNAQIDSAQIKAEADLNKMLVAESTKDFRDAQQSQQNLEQQIESLNERPGTSKAPTGSKPIQQG